MATDTRDLDSMTKLTEFAPLSPEVKQTGFFAKLFRRSTAETLQQSQARTDPLSSSDDVQNIDDVNQTDDNEGVTEGSSENDLEMPDPEPSPQSHRRTLSSVLRRLSNILDTRGQTPQVYKDSDFKQFWMPDRHCKECYECGDRFNTFRRRHHCRVCGQIFCSRCCNQEVPGKIMGYTGFLRVCTYCCRVVLSYAQSQDVPGDFQAFGEDLRRQMMRMPGELESLPDGSTSQDLTKWTPRKGYRVQMSTIFDEESRISNRDSSTSTNAAINSGSPFDMTAISDLETLQTLQEEQLCVLKDSIQLKELSQCLLCPDDGLELRSHRHRLRTYSGCLVGSEIVDWLVMKGKAVSREQAVAIGQALLDGGWLECVSSTHQVFSDLYSLYRPRQNTSEETLSTEDLEQSIPVPDDPEDDLAPLWFKAIERNQSLEEESMSSLSELNKIPSTVSVPEDLNMSSKSVFFVETPPDHLQDTSYVTQLQRLSAKSLNDKVESGLVWRTLGREMHRSDSGSELDVEKHDDGSSRNEDRLGEWEFLDNSRDQSVPANQESSVESRPMDFGLSSFKGTSPSEEVQKVELAPPSGWQESDHFRKESIDSIAYDQLKETHKEHTISFIRQLLHHDGLSMKWVDTVLTLSQCVAGQVRPDVRDKGDDMDIRQYVTIKKIPGGFRSHSCIVSGVVCTKTIAHKRMQQSITNPKILLLRGPIEYQRVENKFSSLEPQILQEHEFLKNCVNRIAALKPDVLLVEKTVSRLAQEYILDAGITLILNVKPSVMERVARLTQSDIVTSIDSLVGKTTMGVCKEFRTQTYIFPGGEVKHLLYFDGCVSHLGCTITLRGGSSEELTKVKRILQFIIYVAYHSKLEVAFLMDEFAMPPSAPSEKDFELSEHKDGAISGEDGKGQAGSFSKSLDGATIKCGEQATVHTPGDIKETQRVSRNSKSHSSQHLSKPDHDMSSSGSPSRSHRSPSRSRGSQQVVDITMTEILDQSDPLQNYQISKDESIFEERTSNALTEVKQTGEYFKKALSDTLLSISPSIKYDIPYLETETGSKCELRKYFTKEIYWSERFNAKLSKQKNTNDASEDHRVCVKDKMFKAKPHPFVACKITAPVTDTKTQMLIADFRARGGYIDSLMAGKQDDKQQQSMEYENSPFVWDHKLDCLDPVRHQRIALLFSSYAVSSPNHPNPCVNPWVVTMDYYGRNDITLGGFLERYCFRESYACPSKTCDVPMSEHIRRFVHDHGNLLVVLKRLEKPMPAYPCSILMWQWCRKCKEVTPVVPMSAETWSMSFAKYLELKFHGTAYSKRSSTSQCQHNIHQQHFQYFGYKDTVAAFKYFPITLKEICLPPMILDITGYDITIDQWKTQENILSSRGPQVFSDILDHLLKCQTQVQTESQARIITDFINQVQMEKARFTLIFEELRETLARMEAKYNNSVDSHGGVNCQGFDSLACQVMDSIVRTKQAMAEAVVRWNVKIVEFLQQQKKYEKEKTKYPNVSLQREPSSEGMAETAARWMSKEEDLETEPTFVVKDTSSVTMDTEPTFVTRDTESEQNTLSVRESQPDEKEQRYAGDVSKQVDKRSTDLMGSLEPYHFASSPISVAPARGEVNPQVAHQGGAAVSSGPGSMSSASSGGSVASDRNAQFKSESVTDLDSVPGISHGKGPDDKGHQRSFSLGEAKKLTKQFSLARDGLGAEQEKKSVKTLFSNLLSGAGSDPIPMPFSVEEHHILRPVPPSNDSIPVIIYDQEPSSIIAYALSSAEYEKKCQELNAQQLKDDMTDSPYLRRKLGNSVASADGPHQSEASVSRKSNMLSFFRGGATHERSPIHQGTSLAFPSRSFDIEAVKYTPLKDKDTSDDTDEPDFGIFSSLTTSEKSASGGGGSAGGSKSQKEQGENCHIELQFSDGTANFYCKVYFADHFTKLRKLIFPAGEERYIRSLSRCFTWLVKGGKSGSSFCKTQDDRFILKQMSRYEIQSFNKFAPHYFEYITKAHTEQKPTVLAKILGVYRIGYRNSQTSSESKQDLLVMENLFYNRDITQIFDLKGSMRNRLVTTVGKRMEDLVLLDENLLKLSVDSPLYIRPHSKTVLSLAVANDTQFLASHLIMDYSLLVGMDEARQELVLGVIDYIRTFTWDKKLEMVVKSTYSQLGGQGKMPTVIYPESYRSRFIQSMDRYFLPVPDRWAGLGRNVDC